MSELNILLCDACIARANKWDGVFNSASPDEEPCLACTIDDLRTQIKKLERQLKVAKAEGIREFIPKIMAMEMPPEIKGRFSSELFWKGAFAAQQLAAQYANSLEGK